jgi:hypothetical protein
MYENTIRVWKTTLPLCLVIALLVLAYPQEADAGRINSGTGRRSYLTADRALNGSFRYRVRPVGPGPRPSANYVPGSGRFSGLVIDPYKIGPTIDDVEVDIPKLTAAVQRRLAVRGYYSGPINGQRTNEFVQGLRKFQADASGASTGAIDSYTVENLGLAVAQFAK